MDRGESKSIRRMSSLLSKLRHYNGHLGELFVWCEFCYFTVWRILLPETLLISDSKSEEEHGQLQMPNFKLIFCRHLRKKLWFEKLYRKTLVTNFFEDVFNIYSKSACCCSLLPAWDSRWARGHDKHSAVVPNVWSYLGSHWNVAKVIVMVHFYYWFAKIRIFGLWFRKLPNIFKKFCRWIYLIYLGNGGQLKKFHLK